MPKLCLKCVDFLVDSFETYKIKPLEQELLSTMA